MASLAIRVRRTDFITALEARLVAIPKEQDDYKKALEKHKKDLLAWAKKSLKSGQVELDESNFRNQVHLKWSEKALDSKPVEPTSPSVSIYSVNGTIQEITQGLKLLRLSDEEFVPASVARNLSSLI